MMWETKLLLIEWQADYFRVTDENDFAPVGGPPVPTPAPRVVSMPWCFTKKWLLSTSRLYCLRLFLWWCRSGNQTCDQTLLGAESARKWFWTKLFDHICWFGAPRGCVTLALEWRMIRTPLLSKLWLKKSNDWTLNISWRTSIIYEKLHPLVQSCNIARPSTSSLPFPSFTRAMITVLLITTPLIWYSENSVHESLSVGFARRTSCQTGCKCRSGIYSFNFFTKKFMRRNN